MTGKIQLPKMRLLLDLLNKRSRMKNQRPNNRGFRIKECRSQMPQSLMPFEIIQTEEKLTKLVSNKW